ncbi:hypothetical protein [Pelosinus sp. sgz500959]
MTNYLVYDWNGQMKWTEIMGCYFVDPLYVQEFVIFMPNSRLIPINGNFI